MQSVILFDDYGRRYDEFSRQMSLWLAEGRIKYREDVVDGLENTRAAFNGRSEGKNFGKVVVRFAPD